MDYRDIKIEGGIVTMPLDNFNKIESELDKLMTQREFCKNEYDIESKNALKWYDEYCKLHKEVESLKRRTSDFRHRLSVSDKIIEAFECIAEHGYCYVRYSSTDCDNRTAEGVCKITNPSKFIEALYNNAEGSTSYELITKNLDNYEEYRTSYGGWN